MNKGFMETIEELWKEKNDEIIDLKDKIFNREKQIEILADKIIKLKNFKCIHEEGEYQRGHRYCDDKCPLVEMSRIIYDTKDGNYMLHSNLLCKKKKAWSK